MTDTKFGGWSDTKDATPKIQKICDEVNFSLPSFFTTSTHKIVYFAFQSRILLHFILFKHRYRD